MPSSQLTVQTSNHPERIPNTHTSVYGVWTGQSISVFGSMLTSLSIVLWLQQKGATPATISYYFMAGSITSLVAGIFAGSIADRYAKRRLVLISDAVAGIGVVSLSILYFTDTFSFWPLVICIIGLRSLILVASSIRGPALSAYVAAVVHKDRFRRFNSLFTASRQVSGAAGEASGATMFSLFGAGAMFGIDLASYLVAIFFSIFCMRKDVNISPPMTPVKTGRFKTLLKDAKEGLDYIRTNRELTKLVALALTMNLFYAPVIAWIPFRIANAVPEEHGWLGYANAALTIGMICGSLLGGHLAALKGREMLAIKFASLIVGIVLIGYGEMEGRLVSLIFSSLLGLTVGFFNVVEISYIVEVARPEMHGRVLAFVSTLGQVISPISIAIGGLIAESSQPGLGHLFIASGCGMVISSMIFILRRTKGVQDGSEKAAN